MTSRIKVNFFLVGVTVIFFPMSCSPTLIFLRGGIPGSLTKFLFEVGSVKISIIRICQSSFFSHPKFSSGWDPGLHGLLSRFRLYPSFKNVLLVIKIKVEWPFLRYTVYWKKPFSLCLFFLQKSCQYRRSLNKVCSCFCGKWEKRRRGIRFSREGKGGWFTWTRGQMAGRKITNTA